MINDEKLAELKKAHGEIHITKGDGLEFAIRCPTAEECDRFDSELEKDRGKRLSEAYKLFRRCCVHPSAAEVDAIIERRPGLRPVLGGQALHVAGYTTELETEKA